MTETADEKAYRYRKRLEYAGICMTCVDGAPDHFGCTDCLNSGWRDGDPQEQIKALEARLPKVGAVRVQISSIHHQAFARPEYITVIDLPNMAVGTKVDLPPFPPVAGRLYMVTVEALPAQVPLLKA